MSKRTIIFQEHKKITIKEIDELFYFTILYYDKWSSRNIIKQSEYIVVAACRGLMKISLEEVNGKDYLFITDDISDFTDYPKQIDDFLSLQCDNDSKVTAEMLYHAILDSTNELFQEMRLTDIYYNYKYLSEGKTGSSKIDIYTSSFDKYINDIFNKTDDLVNNGTIINFRLWVGNEYKDKLIDKLNEHYKVNIGDLNKLKLSNNVFFEIEEEFIWPSYDNDYWNKEGSCRGTRDHIAILVDGTVVPCCLDSQGIISLGNIYKQNLNDIISSVLFKEINLGFRHNVKVHPLCQKCNFYELRR